MAYRDLVVADSPIGYWNFNDGTATDQSGSNFHGTPNGTVTFDAALNDMLVMGLNCNGGRIQIGNPAALQLETLTLEAWISTSKNDASYQAVVYKDSAYAIFVKNGRFYVHDRGTDRDSGVTVAGNGVHHLVVTQRVPPALTGMYVDGTKRADVTMGVLNQTQPLAIGNGYSTDVARFVGILDEVAIYPTILSDARIAAHYSEGNRMLTGQMGVYSGSAFDPEPIERWTSSIWEQGPIFHYTGTDWIPAP